MSHRPNSEQRSQTALGIAMIGAVVMLSLLVAVALAAVGHMFAAGAWSIPAPTVSVALVTGFILLTLRRRRP